MPFIRMTGILASSACLVLTSPGAQAQSAVRAIDTVIACRSLIDTTERLACFDKSTEPLAEIRASGELVALDRTKVVQSRKDRFGLPATRRAPTSDPLGALQEIDATIAGVQPSGYDRLRLTITDNGVWETLEPLSFPPAAGERVKITKSNFGGYRATVGKGRSILVKRVR